MENEKITEEQPITEQTMVSNETDTESAASCEGSSECDTVESLGKFKSSRALLEAYNSLQAEFTKKCQKLSELEKEKTLEQTPEKKDERLEKFLSSNRDAQGYRDEFKAYLDTQEKEIGSLEGVWAKFVLNKLSSSDEGYLEEPILNKYIFQDENVRNKIIENMSYNTRP